MKSWFDVFAFRIDGVQSRKVAAIFTNITERTKADRALRESAQAIFDLDRRKDEFLAMLGHELRNPIAPIVNAVQMLRLQKRRPDARASPWRHRATGREAEALGR